MPTTPTDDPIDLALPRPAAPSTSQSHGTVLLAVLAGFLVLAALLWFSVRDVGPFETEFVGAKVSGTTHEVTVEVTNEGNRAGRANCQVLFREGADLRPSRNFQTSRIDGGDTLRETVQVDADAEWHVTDVQCR